MEIAGWPSAAITGLAGAVAAQPGVARSDAIKNQPRRMRAPRYHATTIAIASAKQVGPAMLPPPRAVIGGRFFPPPRLASSECRRPESGPWFRWEQNCEPATDLIAAVLRTDQQPGRATHGK